MDKTSRKKNEEQPYSEIHKYTIVSISNYCFTLLPKLILTKGRILNKQVIHDHEYVPVLRYNFKETKSAQNGFLTSTLRRPPGFIYPDD